MDRRQMLSGSLGAAVVALTGCTDVSNPPAPCRGASEATAPCSPLAAPGSPGLVDEDWWQGRAAAYLDYAVAMPHSSNPTGTVAHLVRAQNDPDHQWDPSAVTEASLERSLAKIDNWEDPRDFDVMYLIWALALGGSVPDPVLPEATVDAIRRRLLENRWRWDDPLPADRVDHMWYWSENHRVITAATEYLAGQMMPDEIFEVTGLKGETHRERARVRLFDWFDERARFGFFEWHSNVYMLKNITPLLELVELVENDDEVIRGAAATLDTCLIDLAAHQHQGVVAAPHGRSYAKDTMRGPLEDTWNSAKFLFDSTDLDWTSRTDNGATYLAAARRYRPPQLMSDIASDPRPGVIRERHGVFFDDTQPVDHDIEAPFGRDFRDPANLDFWFSLGALGMWPVAEVLVDQANEHRIWEGDAFSDVALLGAINGYDPVRIAEWTQANAASVNFGFLSEAHTYTWRSPEVTMSSVVDHRKGAMRDQIRSWKAVMSPDALVFTQHPNTPPPEGDSWSDDSSPGYWTGESSMPRSAQHENLSIHLYRPGWEEDTIDSVLWAVFGYEPYTHAFVPTEHFDEVIEAGNWVFLRLGDGYLGLWSHREPTWRDHDPTQTPTGELTERFDLVAEGGPDNVWIAQAGRAEDDGSFAGFVAQFVGCNLQVSDDLELDWEHPGFGRIQFSWDGDFVVGGETQPLAEHPRLDSPWGTVEHLDTLHELSSDASTWTADPSTGQRNVG